MKGAVFDIQRFCVHDGHGIRTTVFMKGCPLRCRWCHNPERLTQLPQVQFFDEECIGCMRCSRERILANVKKCLVGALKAVNNSGINPDAYVSLQEIKPQFDADGSGTYKQTEIEAAINALPGSLTKEQKAALWQLTTGATSAKKNPYSREIGYKVFDEKNALPEADDEDELEGLTLGSW